MEDSIYWFTYVESSLYLQDEAYLISVDKLFDVFLDSFANILLHFPICVRKEHSL